MSAWTGSIRWRSSGRELSVVTDSTGMLVIRGQLDPTSPYDDAASANIASMPLQVVGCSRCRVPSVIHRCGRSPAPLEDFPLHGAVAQLCLGQRAGGHHPVEATAHGCWAVVLVGERGHDRSV
jgi:hypothetical protein